MTVGQQLANDVKLFNRGWAKTVEEIRRCSNLAPNVEKAFYAFVPEGEKLVRDVDRTFETYGLWSPATGDIADRLKKILTLENFLTEVLDGILMGCECRKAVTFSEGRT